MIVNTMALAFMEIPEILDTRKHFSLEQNHLKIIALDIIHECWCSADAASFAPLKGHLTGLWRCSVHDECYILWQEYMPVMNSHSISKEGLAWGFHTAKGRVRFLH